MSGRGPDRPPGAPPGSGLSLGIVRQSLEATLAAARNDAAHSVTLAGGTLPIRRAAVALILRESQPAPLAAELSTTELAELDTEILLIRRAEHELDPWSGHMALPGGRQDPTDPSLLHTVERETYEEVGLDLPRQAELLGRLPEMPAVARGRQVGMTIAPFVFVVRRPPSLVLNGEVAETLWASLTLLSSGRIDTTVPYPNPEGSFTMQFPAWDVEGRIVWGLTHRMISMLLKAARETSATSAR